MEVLTLSEAAKLLRCTRQTIYAKVDRNEIPYFRLGKGGHIRFDKEVLTWWARKQMGVNAAELPLAGKASKEK